MDDPQPGLAQLRIPIPMPKSTTLAVVVPFLGIAARVHADRLPYTKEDGNRANILRFGTP